MFGSDLEKNLVPPLLTREHKKFDRGFVSRFSLTSKTRGHILVDVVEETSVFETRGIPGEDPREQDLKLAR